MVTFTHKTHFVVYASPEKVFEALTDPGIIASWGGGLSVVGSKPGMSLEMFDGTVSGKILSYIPNKELSYTWRSLNWDKETPPTQVKLVLHPHPAGTDVVLEHASFSTEALMNESASAWVDRVFEPLNDYFTEELSKGPGVGTLPFS